MEAIMTGRKTAAQPLVGIQGFILSTMILVALLLWPRPGDAQKMIGTEYYDCLDTAEILDGICYLNADGYWDKVGCNLEYLANVAGCISQFAAGLTGISTLIK